MSEDTEEEKDFEKLAAEAWSAGFFGELANRGYGFLADSPKEALKASEVVSETQKEASEEIQPKIEERVHSTLQELAQSK